jgi:sugar-specific transcriptional regulator TrmB
MYASSNREASLRSSFPSAEYRLFYALEHRGLVRRTHQCPITYEPLPLQTGLQASFTLNESTLKRLIGGHSSQESTELLIGRQAQYDKYMQLADKAKHEIWIYAIGIAYSEDLEAVQRRAVKRGVSIHHVVQQVQVSNYHVVHKWQRLGVRLKHLPSERGYHVSIFDDSTVMMTFSDPLDTDNRISLISTTPQIVQLFRSQFRSIWNEALEIEI